MSVRVIREPFPIVSVEKSSFKETYGGAEDIVMVFCTLIRTAEPSETCLVTMHPIGYGLVTGDESVCTRRCSRAGL